MPGTTTASYGVALALRVASFASMGTGCALLLWSTVIGLLDFERKIADYGAGWAGYALPLGLAGASVAPVVDLGLALAWILARPHRRIFAEVALAGVLLVSICLAQFRIGMLGPPPKCNCSGALAAWQRPIAAAESSQRLALVLVAIVLMFAILRALGHGLGSRGSGAVRGGFQPRLPAPRFAPKSARGFSLLELITVIAIVGLMLVGSLPWLAQVRHRADQIGSISNLREHVQVFETYAIDYGGIYPFITDPRARWSVVRNGSEWARIKFFDASFAWNIALAPGYYNGVHRSPMFAPPYQNRIGSGLGPILTEYRYSSAFITDWTYWTPETRRSDASQWRPVRTSDVRASSRKGLLIARPALVRPSWNSPTTEVGFVDGSARIVGLKDLTAPYPGAAGSFASSTEGSPLPVVHTPLGFRGADVQ